MIAFILSSFSFTVLTALVPYFIQYQLGMGDQVSFVLLVMLVMIGLFLIPAKKISDKINKGPAYALGLFIASVAILVSFTFPHEPTPWIYAVAAVAGIGFSAQWVFPWSMLPDVVEYDEKMTGDRREASITVCRHSDQVHRRPGWLSWLGVGIIRICPKWEQQRRLCLASASSLPSCQRW
jgi:GPH family glycoside/pentoside/hexuronide:cation symporter